MKKPVTLVIIVAIILSLAAYIVVTNTKSTGSSDGVSSGTSAEGNPALTITLSDLNSLTSFTGIWSQRVKELVETADVNLKVNYYPNGSLTGQDIEAVKAGLCDMLQATASTAAGVWKPLAALDAPYIFTSVEKAMKVAAFDSPAMKYINENLQAQGITLGGFFYAGSRVTTTTSKPIYSVADMKSLKIRVVNGDLYMKLFRAFGSEPTPMAFSEVAAALVTGVCEAQENPYASLVTAKLYEIQNYVIETNHMPANYCMWINNNTLSKMSGAQREVLFAAIEQASEEISQRIHVEMEKNKQICKDNGMTIIDEASGLDIQSFTDAAMTIYDEYANNWGDIVDIIRSCYE